MERFATLVLAAVNWLLPKKNRAVVLGWPNYAPNVIAVVNAILEHTDLSVVLLLPEGVTSPPATLHLTSRVTLQKHRSRAGIWAYLTSRYVFLTHGIFGNRFWSSRQVVVQMWHGMPLKRIGTFVGSRPPQGLDYVVAAGPFWTGILSEAFSVEATNVLATGLPRCDLLLATGDNTHTPLSSLPGISEGDTVIAWLPTFRRYGLGSGGVDGTEMGNALQASDKHFASIDAAFASVGVKCIVKVHPMAPKYDTRSLKSLLFMDDSNLSEASIDLYSILGLCDGLITDVSSVWVDFLSTRKPMLFFFPDLDAYEASRGLTIDDYNAFVPGPLVTDPDDLPDAIRNVFSQASQPRERSKRSENLNMANDADSSLRLLAALGLAKSRSLEQST